MHTKKPLIISIGIAVVLALGLIALLSNQEQTFPNYEYDQYGSKTPEEANRVVSETDGVLATSSALEPSISLPVFSSAEIAMHATESDCWTSIEGQVYNLTSFISEHPGGKRAILELCGRDGSVDFRDAHGKGGRGQVAVFTKYKIGILQE